jgi:hypothetical protein
MRKLLKSLTTLLFRPKVRSEIEELRRQLQQAKKRHRPTKHIYARMRAVTTVMLKDEVARFK